MKNKDQMKKLNYPAKDPKPIVESIVRNCPNCRHPNTKKESLNQYVCRYCEGGLND
jgi:hypothetical protein